MIVPPVGNVLIISGLKQESRIARGPGVTAICGDATTLARELDRLQREPFRLIVSFGLCGGLSQAAHAGDVVIASRVLGPTSQASDPTISLPLSESLRLSGERVHGGDMASVEAPVLSREMKSELQRATGAVAVDMESAIAADFARATDVPFIILRVVSDPADRSLPPIALKATTSQGGISYSAVALGLLGSPTQLPALIAAGRDSARAFQTLRRCYGSFASLFRSIGSPDLR